MFKRLAHILVLSTMLTVSAAQPARAEPISASIMALAAFAATPIGAIVVNVGLMAVSTVGSMLLKNLQGSTQQPVANLGMRLSLAVGGIVAQSFLVGDYATAGSLAYRGSYGQVGDIPNAYYVEERVLSDIPMPNLTGFRFGEQSGTILWAEPAEQGFPILECRVGGVDHMWVRYRDGSQTTADPYLRAKFGTHPERPYTSDMIGVGQATAIVTRLVPPADNRDLFPANLEYIFETDGIPLYDVSKDTTAGGSGSHRWDDPATWEPSNILPVQIYNVLKGIYFDDEWLFGLQTMVPARLPASAWIAGINEARRAITLVGGGSEVQFRGGAEITVDLEPAGVIEKLLNGCSGRLAEIGGIYKPLIGAPGAAVYSFSDANIVVTAEQGYEPFPQTERTYNGVRAKYPERTNGWQLKDAPAYYSPTLEAEDGGRRLAADVTFEAVSSNTQVQRLVQTVAEEQRRWRKHRQAHPPIVSEYEPLDVVAYTSSENGYVNKKFLITDMQDQPSYLQLVDMQELDPEDYDWVPGTDERPRPVAELPRSRPAPVAASGFFVEGAVIEDANGRGRRPAIDVHWNGDMHGLQAVRITIRLEATEAKVWQGLAPRPLDGVARIGQNLLSLETYEVEIEPILFSTARTVPSSWLPVTTPDVRLSIYDINDEMRKLTGVLPGAGSLIDRFNALQEQLDDLAESVLKTGATGRVERRVLEVTQNSNRAYFVEQITIVVDTTQASVDLTTLLLAEFEGSVAVAAERMSTVANELFAQATFAQEVAAEYEGTTASAFLTMTAYAGVAGWDTTIAAIVRAEVDGTNYEAGLYILLDDTGQSAVAIKANSFHLLDDTAGVLGSPFSIVGGIVYMADVRISGSLILDASVNTNLLMANAVYGGVSATQGSNVGSGASIVSVNCSVVYGTVKVSFTGAQARPVENSSNFGLYYLRLLRNGSVIKQLPYFYDDNFSQPLTIEGTDTPGVGTHTYSADTSVASGLGLFDIYAGGELIVENFKA